MEVKLLRIDAANRAMVPNENSCDPFVVRVELWIDGERSWHEISVRPNFLSGVDASLLIASEELQDVFRLEQFALHRICHLVGSELRGGNVRLPQQIAA